jgi:hypothetical protein
MRSPKVLNFNDSLFSILSKICDQPSDLTEPPLEVTYNFERVPVRVYDFDVQENIDQALQIEISENTQRRDYTSEIPINHIFQIGTTKC